MKKQIWFDVDDVLVDTASEIYRSFLLRTGIDLPISSWKDLFFTKNYKLGEDGATTMRGWWKEDKIIENARPHDFAIELIHKLSKDGYSVNMITARAWHPEAKQLTEDFIRKHNLPIDELKLLKYEESKKELLAPSAKSTVAFVDDSPHHIVGALELGIPAVLLRRSWNVTEQESLKNIGNLSEFIDHFKLTPKSKRILKLA